jgi:hypothetical protein
MGFTFPLSAETAAPFTGVAAPPVTRDVVPGKFEQIDAPGPFRGLSDPA